MIKIAVLSDLHVGGARSLDLYPPDQITEEIKSRYIDSEYVDTFIKWIESEAISANYLILPGDLSNGGKPSQVALAHDVVVRCSAALGIPDDCIVFVPGNHDVDWEMLKPGYDHMRHHSFNNASNIFKEMDNRSSFSVLNEPYFSQWNYDKLLIIGYNSTSHHKSSTQAKYGMIPAEHLDAMANHLKSLTYEASQIRLFLVHHHPVLYSDPTGLVDFSAMQNAESLMQLLIEHKFDLLVHGHRHHPRVRSQDEGMGHRLAIFCAGSFSAPMFSGWEMQVNNQFHLIEVESRDLRLGLIKGQVKSWTYAYGRGWEPSFERSGIQHIEPFGLYQSRGELCDLIRPVLSKILNARNYALWSEIEAHKPIIRHVPTQLRRLVIQDLSIELEFEVMQDERRGIVLFKR